MADYLAGVAPGGLKEIYLVKILICYLLETLNAPLSAEQMSEIFETDGVVDYFTFVTALQELREQHLAVETVDEKEFFTLTERGKETAESLNQALPSSLRERVVRQGMKLLSRLRKSESVRVSIEKEEHGYRVTGTLQDGDLQFLSLTLYAPNEEQAEVLAKNFYDEATPLYQAILGQLTK